ncbi:MAG: oligosaccharide flippase family protein, partial [Anaerolineae bacterium]|nr:oligosaccharide flippase family protein [Anaerolineae bacterium]NIN98824.1 oligosaccharide flippase family protein [Anaerolineae bacterium]NIQ81743.1 oligosaccharide flippase family protein [Anaerolineae bacterium]
LLIITFTNLGVGPATVYYVAQEKYSLREVLGNNVLLSAVIGTVATLVGLGLVVLSQGQIFPSVAPSYLALALLLVPVNLFSQQYVNHILLGARRIKEFSAASVLQKLLFLPLVFLTTVVLGLGVFGALWATILSSTVLCVFLFPWVMRIAGGIRYRLNYAYLRDAFRYGIKAHLGNIIGFLNYRVEVFLLGIFLPVAAVGFYAVAVGLAEKLWFLSESASTVLFPTVSAEKDEYQRKTFTPLVSRNILFITALGAAALFLVSEWVIVLLYSEEYLLSVRLFRILLPGIVLLSASRILANDIAGRGLPLLNTYVGAIGVVLQVALNLVWIPRYGASGAAWATTVSYGITLAVRLWMYMRLSGNSWATVIVPQPSDWLLYRQLARLAWSRVRR